MHRSKHPATKTDKGGDYLVSRADYKWGEETKRDVCHGFTSGLKTRLEGHEGSLQIKSGSMNLCKD